MKSAIISLLSFCLIGFPVLSQAQAKQQESIPSSFSLDEARSYAITHSYSAIARVNDVERAKQKVNETRAIGLPQVNGKVDFQNFLIIPRSPVPGDFFGQPGTIQLLEFGAQYNMTAGITASQLLFDGSYLVGLQAAKTYVALAENDQLKSEIEIKVEVTKAYANALLAKENKKILLESISTVDRIYKETQAMYEAGFVEATDADQIKLTLSNLRSTLTQIERQETIIYNLLKFTMGVPISHEMTLTDDINSILLVNDGESIADAPFDVNGHIDYRQILVNYEAQSLLVKNEKAAYLPRLSAFYSYQEAFNRNEFSPGAFEWFPSSLVGVTLEVPIFSSFMRKNKVEQAKLNLKDAEVLKTQLSQSLEMGVSNAKSAFISAADNYRISKENLELSKRIKENTFKKYKEGLASSFELNTAQNQELDAQGNYIGAMLQLIDARASLEKAFGSTKN